VNIPFHDFLDTKTGKLKSPKEALDIVTENNIHSNKKIINYCGGGIAATLDAFVLLQLGFENLEIYDNSMSEWAKDKTLPIETDVSGGL
jgi:thiosulfate/3-mercaptopyruvate sulfurtransferase